MLTGRLVVAHAGANVTICSRKHGIYVFGVKTISRIARYMPQVEVPGVDNLRSELKIADSYHCTGGSGEPDCGPNFGGFSDEQKKSIKDAIFYSYEGHANLISDGCLLFGVVNRCTAVWYEGNETMVVLKKVKEECEAKIESEKIGTGMANLTIPYSRRLGKTMVLGRDGGVNLTIRDTCRWELPQLVLGYNGKIFPEEYTKALFYEQHSPIYREPNSNEWIIRGSLIHHQGYATGYALNMEWHGLPQGINNTVNLGVSGKNATYDYKVNIDKAIMEYELEMDDDDELDCTTTETINKKCTPGTDNLSFVFKGWTVGFQGIPLVNGLCKSNTTCYALLALQETKTNSYETHKVGNKVFGPKAQCVFEYTAAGVLTALDGATLYQVGMVPKYTATKIVFNDYMSNHFGTNWKIDVFSIIAKPFEVLEKYFWLLLIVVMLVLFPGLTSVLFTKIGFAIVVVLYITYKAKTVEAVRYESYDVEKYNLEMNLALGSLILGWVPYSWVLLGAKLLHSYKTKQHWFDMFLQIMYTYLSIKYDTFSEKTAVVAVFFLKLAIADSKGFLQSIDRGAVLLWKKISKSKTIVNVVKKRSVFTKFSVEVIFGEFKKAKRKERIPIKGRVRNVRNMEGSLFYKYEYYKLSNHLRRLSAREICDLYKYFPPLTIREPMTEEQMLNIEHMLEKHIATKKEIKRLKLENPPMITYISW